MRRYSESWIELPAEIPSVEEHERTVTERILGALRAKGFPCALVLPDDDWDEPYRSR